MSSQERAAASMNPSGWLPGITDAALAHPKEYARGSIGTTEREGYLNAAKTLMVENLSVLFAAGDLKFASDLPIRKESEEELASFTIQTTAAGNQIVTQSRNTSGHSDAGVALIVAAFASQYLHRQSITVSTLSGYY